MKRSTARYDKTVWILIFGGLLVLGPGFALLRADEPWGWLVVVAGGAAALVGVVLVYVRSRMPDPSEP